MTLKAHARGVLDITADELRAYVSEHGEDDYLLIDVRQPEEYAAAHLPGAVHIPLMELEGRTGEIVDAPEATKIFYCHAGGRSARAAGLFGDSMGLANVFNLAGGISAYTGRTLADFPVVRVFTGKGTPREVLLEAIELEKGADRLYEALATHFAGSAIEHTIRAAARAEREHGRAVYAALERLGEGDVQDFDELYDSLPGDVLEGGATVEATLAAAEEAVKLGDIALLELALELELTAYDLYRTLAHGSDTEALAQTFLELAEQEKSHARALAGAIDRVAALP